MDSHTVIDFWDGKVTVNRRRWVAGPVGSRGGAVQRRSAGGQRRAPRRAGRRSAPKSTARRAPLRPLGAGGWRPRPRDWPAGAARRWRLGAGKGPAGLQEHRWRRRGSSRCRCLSPGPGSGYDGSLDRSGKGPTREAATSFLRPPSAPTWQVASRSRGDEVAGLQEAAGDVDDGVSEAERRAEVFEPSGDHLRRVVGGLG